MSKPFDPYSLIRIEDLGVLKTAAQHRVTLDAVVRRPGKRGMEREDGERAYLQLSPTDAKVLAYRILAEAAMAEEENARQMSGGGGY